MPDPSRQSGCGAVFAVLLVGLILAVGIFLIFTEGANLRNLFTPDEPPGPPALNGGGGGGNAVTYIGSDATGEVPIISERDFTGGNAPVTASGAFSLGSTIALDMPAAFSDGVETFLSYGYNGASGGVLIGFSQREGAEGISVNATSGDWVATYVGQGCSWEVEVTAVTVSGHIACTDIPAVNEADGAMGTVDIELDFTANSPAGDAEPSA